MARGFVDGEKAALAGAEHVAGERVVDRHDHIFVDEAGALGEIQHVEAEGADFGIVDQQAGVVEAEGAAERCGDGLEQGLAGEAAHHGIVDFEQGAEAVALAGELLFVGAGGLVVERVIDRHGHLAGHLLHEFDVAGRIGVFLERAKVQAADLAAGGEQRKNAERLDAVGFEQAANDGVALLPGDIGDVVGLAGFEGEAGRGLVERDGAGGVSGDRVVGLQDVKADGALLGVEQGEADEIEGYEAFQAAAEIGEESGKLVMGSDRLGDFEEGLIPCAGGVRRCGGRGRHRRAEPAFVQPYHYRQPHHNRTRGRLLRRRLG